MTLHYLDEHVKKRKCRSPQNNVANIPSAVEICLGERSAGKTGRSTGKCRSKTRVPAAGALPADDSTGVGVTQVGVLLIALGKIRLSNVGQTAPLVLAGNPISAEPYADGDGGTSPLLRLEPRLPCRRTTSLCCCKLVNLEKKRSAVILKTRD